MLYLSLCPKLCRDRVIGDKKSPILLVINDNNSTNRIFNSG